MKKSFIVVVLMALNFQVMCADSLSEQYDKKLANLCNEYNAKLEADPFFDGSKLTYKPVSPKAKKNVILREYSAEEKKLTSKFRSLINGEMANKLKKTDVDKYIEAYVVAHPEKKDGIEDIRLAYRCHDKAAVNQAVLASIDNKSFALESCRDVLYDKYSNLFTDKAEFEKRYNEGYITDENSEEFALRKEAIERLNQFEEYQRLNSKLNLKGQSGKRASSKQSYILGELSYFKRNFFYEKALDMVFDYNRKLNKEYAKNGQYFASKQNFFDSYVSTIYKLSLKANKQSKKK